MIFIIYLLYTALYTASSSKLSESIFSEIQSLAVESQVSTEYLITKVDAYGDADEKAIPSSELDTFLSNVWSHLPSEMALKFRSIAFTESTVFESFSIILSPTSAEVTEWVGSARHLNGSIELAYIQTTSQGHPITQYDTVSVRKCHRCWIFAKCCHTENEKHSRGFTVTELAVMLNVLREHAYQYLSQSFRDHFGDESLTDTSSENQHIRAGSSKELVEQVVRGLAKEISHLQAQLDESADNVSVVVERIVDRGVVSFSEHTYVQQFNGISYEFSGQFGDWLEEQLSIPAEYRTHLRAMMSVVQHSTSDEWILYELSYSLNQGAGCYYAVLLGRNDKTDQSTDWLVGQITTEFVLAPDLLIICKQVTSMFGLIKYGTEDIVTETPVSLTPTDIAVVFDFFNIIIYKRFAAVLGVFPYNAYFGALETPTFSSRNHSILGVESELIPVVTTILDWWPKIVAGFKTTRDTKVIKEIAGKGFDHFKGSGVIDEVTNLESEFIDSYADIFMDEINLPEDKRKVFLEHLSLIPHLQKDEFAVYDVLFDIGKGGECKYVGLMALNSQDKKTTSFLITNYEATFSLAPDVVVVQKSKSYVGGIYESVDVEYQYKSRAVSEEDVQAVFAFFKMMSMSKLAEMEGIDLPEDPSAASTSVIQ